MSGRNINEMYAFGRGVGARRADARNPLGVAAKGLASGYLAAFQLSQMFARPTAGTEYAAGPGGTFAGGGGYGGGYGGPRGNLSMNQPIGYPNTGFGGVSGPSVLNRNSGTPFGGFRVGG